MPPKGVSTWTFFCSPLAPLSTCTLHPAIPAARVRQASRPPARPAKLGFAFRAENRAGVRADLGVGFCVESNVGFGAMANALCAGYTPRAAKMFRETGKRGASALEFEHLPTRGSSLWGNRHRREHTRSMRRSVFLAAGGEQDRRDKDHDDDGHDKERGRNVHGACSLLLSD